MTALAEMERLYREERAARLAYEVAVARHDGIHDALWALAFGDGLVERDLMADVEALLAAARRRCEETRAALKVASRTTHAAVMALTTARA